MKAMTIWNEGKHYWCGENAWQIQENDIPLDWGNIRLKCTDDSFNSERLFTFDETLLSLHATLLDWR